jgi:endonuclease/exonuclease/phosphatase family metal-dependent hydrolase
MDKCKDNTLYLCAMKKWIVLSWLICVIASFASAQERDTVRIMHYNILKYGFDWACMSKSAKNNALKAIFSDYQPDILTVNEIEPSMTVMDDLRAATLAQYEPAMKTAPFSNSNGSDIVNALYYNSTTFGHLELRAIRGNVRDIDVHRLYYKPATSQGDTLDFWLLVAHLKAGTDFAADRAEAAKDIANWLTANKNIQRYLLAGDFNLYSSNEQTWQTLTGGTSPRFIDPAGQLTGWDGVAFAKHHTQSPNDKNSNSCAATGGMDNRFDFILASPAMTTGVRDISVFDYRPYGNDGVSYNEFLDCNDTRSVSSTICSALRRVSDHLPVVMSMTLPRKAEKGVFGDAPFRAEIWGNPAREQLTVQLSTNESGLYKWQIADVLGRYTIEGERSIRTPGENFVVDLPESIVPGTYFLILRNAKDQGVMLRFVKRP